MQIKVFRSPLLSRFGAQENRKAAVLPDHVPNRPYLLWACYVFDWCVKQMFQLNIEKARRMTLSYCFVPVFLSRESSYTESAWRAGIMLSACVSLHPSPGRESASEKCCLPSSHLCMPGTQAALHLTESSTVGRNLPPLRLKCFMRNGRVNKQSQLGERQSMAKIRLTCISLGQGGQLILHISVRFESG